ASVSLAPPLWCLVILRYTQPTAHPRAYRWVQVSLVVAGVALMAALALTNPFPSYDALFADRAANRAPSPVPLAVWLYVPYMAACYVVPLIALLTPPAGAPARSIPRHQARPWLVATSLLLLLVGLVVTVVGMWAAQHTQALVELTPPARQVLFLGDLVALAIVATAITLLGRTIVAYEVFTERPLPRRGFWRMWRGIVVLAAGFAGLVAFLYRIELRPIYSLVTITILAGVVYAIFSWQRYRDHEAFVAALRPFIASTGPHEQLLSDAPAEAGVHDLFQTLCRDVLGADRAGMLLAGLTENAGPRWIGYRWDPMPAIDPAAWPAADDGPVRLDAHTWALPLADRRGAVGALILGPRARGGDYTAEEMDVARAAGERILDVVAGAQVARVMADLVRQRIAEAQVMSARNKRVLHDEALPQLHLALLHLATIEAGAPALAEARDALTQAHRTISDLMRDMAVAAPHHLDRDGLAVALQRALAHDFAGDFDAVEWQVSETPDLSPFVAQVVFYAAQEAVRNAARYGHGGDPARPLHLTIAMTQAGGEFRLVVHDDGVGLRTIQKTSEVSRKRTSEVSGGTGTGLIFHHAMLALVGGTLTVESRPGHGTSATITITPRPPLAGSAP
ncbi:MAG: ATP-binding protein, partial [Chloroflexi bacterium]|nr:ATP-binding protein [Chloroflexota bacterium]